MKILEEELNSLCITLTQNSIDTTKGLNFFGPWLFYCLTCALYGTVASFMTTYFGQPASGSGVAELIGYLNGVNYPGFIK